MPDLFAVVLRNDDIQEFDSKCDKILLPMTQIPSDDILENLYKLRIRDSEKLKTVSELYNMEIHQKNVVLDDQRLKTNGEKKYRGESTNRIFKPETEIMKETPRSRIRGQNSVNKEVCEIVGNGITGSVLKETIAVSGTIRMSVQNRHSRILLRALLRGRV